MATALLLMMISSAAGLGTGASLTSRGTTCLPVIHAAWFDAIVSVCVLKELYKDPVNRLEAMIKKN